MRVENRWAVVEVLAGHSRLRDTGALVVTSLRVVGRRKDGTGGEYVAHLPPCLRDECREGRLTECKKPYGHISEVKAWLKHSATHCHDWHEASARRFAEQVLKTYGKPVPAPGRAGIPAGGYFRRPTPAAGAA
jgi:hypothetical protein